MEYEIGIGIIKGHKINEAAAKVGGQLHLEIRTNIVETPFDVGVQATLSRFDRESDYAQYEHTIQNRGTLIFMSDYNLRKWKHVQPFFGLGVGMAFVDHTYSRPDIRDDMTYFDRSFVFNPRIGVELFSHFRITAEYKWMRKEYSHFGVNIGLVLNGGRKKK